MHTYIFIAPHGKHAKILQGESGLLYQYAIHAFYKHYDLPHNYLFADKGEHILQTCQPTYQEIESLIYTLSV